jgi:phosphoribosyl-ATP pyrophosphohydrolase
VIVEVTFELSEVADFLFVIVSLTHSGMSLRDVPSEC